MKPHHDISDERVVRALTHPLRVRILALLEDRTASPSELAAELSAPLGTVSYHVRTLVRLGLLQLVGRKQRRGAIEHYYRAVSRPRITDQAWGELPEIVKRALVDSSIEQVAGYVGSAAAAGGFNVADAHLTRSPVTVDDIGWHKLSAELARVLERIARIEAESKERLARKDHADERRASVVMMLFESGEDGGQRMPPRAATPRRRATKARVTS
jgi:DNA-binding transcriptional ArsR family regulator